MGNIVSNPNVKMITNLFDKNAKNGYNNIIIIDREIFTNIINLWFNTLNIKGASTINISEIITCSFNYYYAMPNIDILCTFTDYGCDEDDAVYFQTEYVFHSNGKVIEKKSGGYRGRYLKCRLSEEQINKLISFLLKLQINFSHGFYRPGYQSSESFEHCGKQIASHYNVDIINYKKTYITKAQVIKTFYELFSFLKNELKIKGTPSVETDAKSFKLDVSENYITHIDDKKSWKKGWW
eukprot:391699_1